MPPTQICEPGHAIPHPPQLARLDDGSTQLEPQSICPIWQTVVHSPLWQTCPAGHARPHMPQ